MINWGVIGLGNMANKFASAIIEITNAKLLGVSSSKSERLNNKSKICRNIIYPKVKRERKGTN